MNKIEEVFKTITGYFNLHLGLSIIAVSFLFSPQENRYEKSKLELGMLEKITYLNKQGFLNWLEKNDLHALPDSSTGAILPAIKKQYNIYGMTLNAKEPLGGLLWSFYPKIEDLHPAPLNQPLLAWEKWLNSADSIKIYLPDWKSGFIQRVPDLNLGDSVLFYACAIQPPESGIPQPYTLRTYFTRQIDIEDARRGEDITLRSLFARTDSLNSKDYSTLKDDSSILVTRFNINDTRSELLKNKTIKEWLVYEQIWDSISSKTAQGENVLPNLKSVWSEVSGKTLSEAKKYFTENQFEYKEFNLAGISFSFKFVSLIIPLAYLILNLLILLHLKFVYEYCINTEEAIVYPYTGFYKGIFAVGVNIILVQLMPVIFCIWLFYNYGGAPFSNFISIVSFILCLLVLLSGLSVEIMNYRVRKQQAGKTIANKTE